MMCRSITQPAAMSRGYEQPSAVLPGLAKFGIPYQRT